MVTTTTKLSFMDFLEQYPEDGGAYELIDGAIVQMDVIRSHKNVSRFLVKTFDRESERLELDYIVDKDIFIRTLSVKGEERGRLPDVSVVAASEWNSNVTSYGAVTQPIQLAVEIVSTNWEDDYVDKLDEYERLGITEYWIVDYLAIASRKYLGNPKQPTIFIHYLVEGKYQVHSFIREDILISPTFGQLNLTCQQVLASSKINSLIL